MWATLGGKYIEYDSKPVAKPIEVVFDVLSGAFWHMLLFIVT